jgi:hypothetical protein
MIVSIALLCVAAQAQAKDAKRVAKAPTAKKAEKAEKAEAKPAQEASAEAEATPSAPAPANTKIKTKTYNFGAMDVEGKLKTPQLLYFLNRVKLELDMSAPDKRSFMKELERSADDKSL